MPSLGVIGIRELLDIAMVGVTFYAVIVWLRRARAGLVVVGALALGVVYLAAREFRLELTASIFQGVFTILLIILVVVLQNDLRRLFERIALWGFRRKGRVAGGDGAVAALCSAVQELVVQRRGALIVIPGRDPVERFVQGGESLDGKLSHSLLVSLFDPGSTGHDGAVIVDGGRVTRFAVHLPLTSNFEELRERGTRHSAALGLSELADALCIVVSEERGEVAVARDGRLRRVDRRRESLQGHVVSFLSDRSLIPARSTHRLSALRSSWAELCLAMVLSFCLWLVLVSGNQVSQKTVRVPVLVDNIDPGYAVKGIDPRDVEVTLTGLRREFYFLDPTGMEIRLDASPVGLGRRTFQLSKSDVRHPPELKVQDIVPSAVKLSVDRTGKEEAKTDGSRPTLVPGAKQ